MSRHTLTESERAERRRADRQRLEQAARALLTSEGWQRWVRVRSTNGLARYSFHNQLLIALQCPVASHVAGFRAFLNFTQGDHGSIIDNKVPAVTAEMQGEAISFTGSAVPPAGLPATTPGTAILISDPLVIQP